MKKGKTVLISALERSQWYLLKSEVFRVNLFSFYFYSCSEAKKNALFLLPSCMGRNAEKTRFFCIKHSNFWLKKDKNSSESWFGKIPLRSLRIRVLSQKSFFSWLLRPLKLFFLFCTRFSLNFLRKTSAVYKGKWPKNENGDKKLSTLALGLKNKIEDLWDTLKLYWKL